jgi:hypothetical protein
MGNVTVTVDSKNSQSANPKATLHQAGEVFTGSILRRWIK